MYIVAHYCPLLQSLNLTRWKIERHENSHGKLI